MQKLTKKSKDILYSTLHDDIMDARIEIQKELCIDTRFKQKVDDILFKLSVKLPDNALKCFKK